jgi:hypothetical protein
LFILQNEDDEKDKENKDESKDEDTVSLIDFSNFLTVVACPAVLVPVLAVGMILALLKCSFTEMILTPVLFPT